jgi:hypothetical protein
MEQPKPTPAQRLVALRIIWAALLAGQIMFLAIALVIGRSMHPLDPQTSQLYLYVAVAMLAVLVPTAYALRAAIYRKARGDDGMVDGAAYVTANILFFAMCEGVGIAAIAFALLNQGRGAVLFVAAIAIAVQVVNFPTGAVMRRD